MSKPYFDGAVVKPAVTRQRVDATVIVIRKIHVIPALDGITAA